MLRLLLAAKPVRTPLEFGINENVRITKINNAVRKTKDGEIAKRNTFMTFTKFDSKGKKMAESEFSYFNLDPSSDYTVENLANQVAHLQNIADVLNPGQAVDPTEGYETYEEIMEDLASKKGCKALMDKTWELFEAAVSEHVGLDSKIVRVKVITDNKGKYLQLPKEAPVVEDGEAECTLNITAYEKKMKAKGLVAPTEQADSKGSAPEKKAKRTGALKGL